MSHVIQRNLTRLEMTSQRFAHNKEIKCNEIEKQTALIQIGKSLKVHLWLLLKGVHGSEVQSLYINNKFRSHER